MSLQGKETTLKSELAESTVYFPFNKIIQSSMRKLYKTNVQVEIENISSSQITDSLEASIVKKKQYKENAWVTLKFEKCSCVLSQRLMI